MSWGTEQSLESQRKPGTSFLWARDKPIRDPTGKGESVWPRPPKASLGLSYPAGVLKEIQSTLEGDRR